MMHERRGRFLLAGLICLALSAAIALAVDAWGAPGLDVRLLRDAITLRRGPGDSISLTLATYGYLKWLGPVSVALAAGYALIWRRLREAAVLAAGTSLAGACNALVKHVFDRPRPTIDPLVHAGGWSMPSGHAAASAAFAASVFFVTVPGSWRVRIVRGAAVVFAACVALSRVVLGVHNPTDVTAGALEGVGVVLLVAAAAFVPPRHVRSEQPETVR